MVAFFFGFLRVKISKHLSGNIVQQLNFFHAPEIFLYPFLIPSVM